MNTFFKKSSLLHTITAVGMAATAIVYALAKAKENSPIIIALLAIGALLELFVASDKAPKYFEYPPFAAALVSVAMFINLAFDEDAPIYVWSDAYDLRGSVYRVGQKIRKGVYLAAKGLEYGKKTYRPMCLCADHRNRRH